MANTVFQTGNTFDSGTVSMGHARKVWRRIEEQLPGGFVIKNVSSFATAGLIRSGMPLAYDTASGADAKDVKVVTWAAIKTAVTGQSPAGIDSLNIIGFLQEDVPVTSSSTFATANVVVKGEIYGYMLGDTVTDAATISAAIKGMTQKNGMSIRVVD